MQIFVKTDKTHTLEVGANDTAFDVKNQVAGFSGLEANDLRLMFGSKQLEDTTSLREAGVSDDSALYVLLRLLGGAKKRKKKTYTKPKKQKHKHKKVKLAVLNYYKVDDSGKVQRTRNVCPEASCGAGIFMAKHEDRVYCGKCGTTYRFNEE